MTAERTSLFADEAEVPLAAQVGTSVLPATPTDEIVRLAHQLPASVYLGTSSWSYPGWNGTVFGDAYAESALARDGLAAYAQHPLLRTVGIDRTFYQAISAAQYARYASQVTPGFRFLVKAPASVSDAVLRGERGAPTRSNPTFLDSAMAIEQFVRPAIEGLGPALGPLVFQLSPLPRELLRPISAAHAVQDRIAAFLAELPHEINGIRPTYAVELRNAELLTPRYVKLLREVGARPCITVRSGMPQAARQSAALRAMDGLPEEGDEWLMKGPLVVRWSLHAGFSYEEAKKRYAPFDRLVDADITTRGTLSHLVHVAMRSGQPSFIIASNKAEGCAPLSLIELAKAIVAR